VQTANPSSAQASPPVAKTIRRNKRVAPQFPWTFFRNRNALLRDFFFDFFRKKNALLRVVISQTLWAKFFHEKKRAEARCL
jgi:hypothetical protein